MIGNSAEAKSPLNQTALSFEDSWQVSEQLLIAGLHQHELADQLRRQLAFVRALTSSLGEGVYAVNLAGRITFVNPAAEQLLGQPEAELLGSDADSIIHLQSSDNPTVPPPPSPLIAVMRDGTSYRNESGLFNCRGGGQFAVAYLAAPIQSDGEIVGAVVSFRDITEMQRLQKLQDETMALLSHDLRTPLSNISGYAQLLQRSLAKQELAKELRWAEALITASQRMNSMIQDVLDRSFLESGRAVHALDPVDLVQLCRQIIDQFGTSTQRARIHLQADAPLPVLANATLIERVVVNLLSNALKYSAPDSPVVIRLSHSAQHATVAVTDRGVGIGEQELPQLFDKFYRTRPAGTTEGTGLGLYGSRLMVEAHGGRIWVESEPGVGSTFSFSLPINSL